MNAQKDAAATVEQARAAWFEAARRVGGHLGSCGTCKQRPRVRCDAYEALDAAERAAWQALNEAQGWGEG